MIGLHLKLTYTVIIATACLLVNCGNYEQNHIKTISDISISDTLYISSIHDLPDTTRLLNPLSALNINDQYLVISERISNNFLKVFSIPDLNILYSWGRQGRGPGEFMVAPTDLGPTEDGVFLFDPLSQSLKTFLVTDSSLTLKDEQDLNYNGQVAPLNRISRINEELYFADYGGDNAISTEDENYEHIALQPDNRDPLFTFGAYPESEFKGFEKYAKYIKTNWTKPDGTLFVTAYTSASNRVKIYDTDGQLQKDIIVSGIDFASDENEDDFLFRTIKWASDNYIYFLGFYESEEKIYSQKPDTAYKTYLEIWDWEGNPVLRFSFDRPIMNFTVSEQLGKIYGYTLHSDDKLFEYDLPNFPSSIP